MKAAFDCLLLGRTDVRLRPEWKSILELQGIRSEFLTVSSTSEVPPTAPSAVPTTSSETSPWPRTVILRPTNIIGPDAPFDSRASQGKFLQWLGRELQKPDTRPDGTPEDPLRLFHDEFRNYVGVQDIADAAASAILLYKETNQSASGNIPGRTPAPLPPLPAFFHTGGPEALTRVDIARRIQALSQTTGEESHRTPSDAASTVRFHWARTVQPVSRSEVDLGYPAPLVVVVNSSAAEAILLGGRPFQAAAEAVRQWHSAPGTV